MSLKDLDGVFCYAALKQKMQWLILEDWARSPKLWIPWEHTTEHFEITQSLAPCGVCCFVLLPRTYRKVDTRPSVTEWTRTVDTKDSEGRYREIMLFIGKPKGRSMMISKGRYKRHGKVDMRDTRGQEDSRYTRYAYIRTLTYAHTHTHAHI